MIEFIGKKFGDAGGRRRVPKAANMRLLGKASVKDDTQKAAIFYH